MNDTAAPADLASRPVSTLTKRQAETLTGKIRAGVEQTFVLLTQAYEEKAWAALGYASWRQYVTTEFGISRGQAYRLVNLGSVTKELSAAAGAPIEVSARQAAKVKPEGAPAVADRIREKLAEKDEPTAEDRQRAVVEALSETASDDGPKSSSGNVTPPEEPAEQPPPEPEVSRARDTRGAATSQNAESASAEPAAEAPPAPLLGVVEPEQTKFVPSVVEAVRLLVEASPEDAAAVTTDELDRLALWISRVRAFRNPRTQPGASRPAAAQPAPGGTRLSQPEPPSPKRQTATTEQRCPPHPVGRVIAGVCMACGQAVGKK